MAKNWYIPRSSWDRGEWSRVREAPKPSGSHKFKVEFKGVTVSDHSVSEFIARCMDDAIGIPASIRSANRRAVLALTECPPAWARSSVVVRQALRPVVDARWLRYLAAWEDAASSRPDPMPLSLAALSEVTEGEVDAWIAHRDVKPAKGAPAPCTPPRHSDGVWWVRAREQARKAGS